MFDSRFVKERVKNLLPNHRNFKKESCVIRRSNSCMLYENQEKTSSRMILKRQLSFDLEATEPTLLRKIKKKDKKCDVMFEEAN